MGRGTHKKGDPCLLMNPEGDLDQAEPRTDLEEDQHEVKNSQKQDQRYSPDFHLKGSLLFTRSTVRSPAF